LVDSTITIAEVIGTFKIGYKKATIPTIAELRRKLFSDNLYKNEILFNRWCMALESGTLRGTFKTTPQPIESSITPWHEAHFR
jgi:hypothetical protein